MIETGQGTAGSAAGGETSSFRSIVAQVRRTFFSKWDPKRQWRFAQIRQKAIHGSIGICDRTTKTIRVISAERHLLIHECCHAVTQGDHGKTWQHRMEEAGKTADRIGDADLARQIRANYRAYADPHGHFALRAADIYDAIRDITRSHLAEGRDIGFMQAIKIVANSYGLPSSELLHFYRRCRQVFRASRREHAKDERLSALLGT